MKYFLLFFLLIPLTTFAASKNSLQDIPIEKKQQFVDTAIDKFFLDNGMDVARNIESSDETIKTGTNDILHLRFRYFTRALVHKITNGGSMKKGSFLNVLKKAGFNFVVFDDRGSFVQVFDLVEGNSAIAK